MARVSAQQLRAQGENQPWTGCPSIAGCTHTYPHSFTWGQVRHTNECSIHISGMWAETRNPEKPTQMWGEGASSTQTVVPVGNIFFSSHQCYDEMMLFMDLLYMYKILCHISLHIFEMLSECKIYIYRHIYRHI